MARNTPPEEDPLKDDPRVIKDDTPFPDPKLYFTVYDSEVDEPDARYRKDVFKLYERWQEKYGRRWPDNGVNTEDLVWLYNEAHNDEIAAQQVVGAAGGAAAAGGAPGAGAAGPRPVPVEKEEYTGEFLTDTEDKAEQLAKQGGAVRVVKPGEVSGNWVTDEFESEEYEMGNLEQLYDNYLFDRDGNPTIMPDGPPEEQLGELSENWDDFYGSLRPRGVDTEEVRDAVWATDEFESDEDNTESEWEPEYVGAGLGLEAEDPINPQFALRHSTHPLAPFPGEALKWESMVYDDGTTYEGLSREALAHGMGVMVFGNGTGGGFHFREVRRGDKYEGEFQAGYAHGLGQLTSASQGQVYIGEFFGGQRHGCGVQIDMSPFYYLVERGEEPAAAYQKTYDRIMRNMEFRTWYRNQPLGDGNEDEHVLYAVRDDFENPYDSLTKAAAHDQKLRQWKGSSQEDKSLQKMVEILDLIHANDVPGGVRDPVQVGKYGDWGRDVPSTTDSHDSVDLQVGNTTDGGYGLGHADTGADTSEAPLDDELAQEIADDYIDNRLEESEDHEAVLGGDILNPTTGLSTREYLDAKEGRYNELVKQQLRQRGIRVETLSEGGLETDEERDSKVKLGRFTEDMFARDMEERAREHREDNPFADYSRNKDRNWVEEHTDTRFETESDMMELCDLAEILGTIDEAQEIINKARMWRWKPYGEVTLRFAQDAAGAPVSLMQEPLHYPHGTKFAAPGPLGQCHPLPEDPAIRVEMARVAQNYTAVYNMYNFDWDPQPGSVQWKIDQRMRRAYELNTRRLERMAEEAAEALQPGGPQQPQEQLQLASVPAPDAPGRSSSSSSSSSGSGNTLLLRGGPPAGTAFASISMSMGFASRALLNTLRNAAKHAPTTRPRLVRPSQLKHAKRRTAPTRS